MTPDMHRIPGTALPRIPLGDYVRQMEAKAHRQFERCIIEDGKYLESCGQIEKEAVVMERYGDQVCLTVIHR